MVARYQHVVRPAESGRRQRIGSLLWPDAELAVRSCAATLRPVGQQTACPADREDWRGSSNPKWA